MGHGSLPLERGERATTGASLGVCIAEKTVGGRTHVRVVNGMSALGERLSVITGNFRDVNLPSPDPYHGETIGIIFDLSELLKHPLRPLSY